MNELFIIKAGFLSEISGFFNARAFEALGAILLIAVGMITKKYIVISIAFSQKIFFREIKSDFLYCNFY